MRSPDLESFANEADVAAAFEARFLDTRKVFSVQRKPQILLEIVSGYVVVAQLSMHQFSVAN